jgi:hypothetical protein
LYQVTPYPAESRDVVPDVIQWISEALNCKVFARPWINDSQVQDDWALRVGHKGRSDTQFNS